MRKLFVLMVLALFAVVADAQNILGKWKTEAGDANVEIFQQGGKVYGKIVWLQKGPDTKDTHNPDAKLRERKLVGVNILSDLAKKDNKWEGGKIYDPKSGKTYKCSIWMEGDQLKVRGHLGIFHDTQTWNRTD